MKVEKSILGYIKLLNVESLTLSMTVLKNI